MVSNEGDGFVKYNGEILEMNLSEWVLRNSAPAMGELTVASSKGTIPHSSINIYLLIFFFFIPHKQANCMQRSSFRHES